MLNGIHQVPEGHVGVYFKYGAIQEDITEPGLHYMIPFVTKMERVQVTLKTDKVSNVSCGTSSGINIMFEQIEV